MSNRRLLDRMVTPEWMDIASRIARTNRPWPEAREELEIALRDEIDAPTGRRKTATVLAAAWLRPADEARPVVEWAREHAVGDTRVWQLGVLMANYAFFVELCGEIGRTLAVSDVVDTRRIRESMKSLWGDRDVVNVATRSSIRTLRSFGVLAGGTGDSVSKLGEVIKVDGHTVSWLVHALLVGRRLRELGQREALNAPELFMFDTSSPVENGYPNLERFTEGGGRVVVGIVQRYERPRASARQITLELGPE